MKMKSLLSMWVFSTAFLVWFSASTTALLPELLPRLVKCRLPGFPLCFNQFFPCPLECPRTCKLDCVTCKPLCNCEASGGVCDDPRFVGGDGITFYFHGRKDRDFCLVSDPNLHINAHFIGKRNPKLKRDFTWVQSIGILAANHKLLLAAKKTSTWDDANDRLEMSFDDAPVAIPATEGAKWQSQTDPRVTILRMSHANSVTVEVENNFRVTAGVVPITREESRVHGYNITDEDCFAHLELGFKFYNLSDMVDGVLGQTYKRDYVSKIKVNVPMPVMGGAHRFSSSGIFATDCSASKFGLADTAGSKNGGGSSSSEYSTLHCTGGAEGKGVVCKR